MLINDAAESFIEQNANVSNRWPDPALEGTCKE
jgi:hypothetical protein